MRTFIATAFLAVYAMTVQAQQPAPLSDPTEKFVAATRDYAAMHRRLERQLPPIEISSSPDAIRRAVEDMATAVRVARADARQGDFFTPELAPLLRNRINEGLRAHGFSADDVLTAERRDAIDPSTVRLSVNGTFPWVAGSAMFPCVINALPPLPPELQYRIVGSTLVLIDVHASLIVDLLPNALVELTLTDRDSGIFP